MKADNNPRESGMEMSASDSSLVSSHHSMMSERKRLYSWSRPTREMRRKGLKFNTANTEHIITGEATIAVHKSGEWFQGNIISNTEDAYSVYGKRIHPYSPKPLRKVTASLPAYLDNPATSRLLPCMETSSSSQSLSPNTSDMSPSASDLSPSVSNMSFTPPSCISPGEDSVCDSLDSELVRQTMEKLALDMVDDGLYNLTVNDFETGLVHNISGVACGMGNDSMYLEADQVTFNSSQSMKGTKADMTILASIGPSLVGQDVIVFKGKMQVTYKDEPCYPVSLEHSQWCI